MRQQQQPNYACLPAAYSRSAAPKPDLSQTVNSTSWMNMGRHRFQKKEELDREVKSLSPSSKKTSSSSSIFIVLCITVVQILFLFRLGCEILLLQLCFWKLSKNLAYGVHLNPKPKTSVTDQIRSKYYTALFFFSSKIRRIKACTQKSFVWKTNVKFHIHWKLTWAPRLLLSRVD